LRGDPALVTTADVSAELDRARRRVAELEAAQALRVRAERVQEALYRIAELASAAGDLQEFYGAVHAVVGELMPATNFFICLYDEARQLISWPYYVDELDDDIPDPNRWEAFGSGDARGTTAYVLRTGEPQLVTYSRAIELAEQGEIEIVGATAEDSSWVGVPLKDEGRTVGVLVVQSYAKDVQYSDKDTELLAFVGQHVGAALSRARAIEETRQRNAELALINSVQEALAGELELQAIYDVVGDRIRAVFDAQVVDIGIFHEASGLIHFPYALERGVRYPDEPIELIGFRKHAMETRQPLLVNENVAEASEHYGNPLVLTGDPPKSGLFVPLVSGGRATGVMSLQNIDREHAFSESDVQLLETLSRSLSVALENARLVHETRQRNAELALINSVQTAIAGELDPQAIYDVVGDRIREVFDAQVVSISTYSDETRLMAFPYVIERDERLEQEPIPLIGFRKHVIETLEPLLLVEKVDEAADRYGNPYVLSGEPVKSAVFVPLAAGRKAIGVVSLQNVDREHAFSEADLRLLVTLCGSLGVALDNARLVSETQQRNAELALINSVQDSIAGELDQQAIYDLVGEKLREVFAAQVVDIAVHDEDAGLLRFVYQFERGVHYPNVTLGVVGFRKHVIETREPLAVLEDMDAALVEYGNPEVVVGEPSHGSAIFQPLVVGGRARGVISIQNLDREHAFSPSDQQLLATIAGSLGVALENAQLVNETRRRVAELATVNSVGQALATQLELDALIELVGERVRETFTADIAYVALHDEAAGKIDFAYYFESGERRPEPPLEYGLGLTSQILESREPLLLNREREYDRLSPVGTPSRSYLGVPIMAGERAIGAISVQSTSEEGRFTDPDARLLATIASNVGVAIQNARLFAEIDRQKQHFESLVEISPVAVVVLDADEHVTGWNPAAAELFGHTAEEAIGREIDDLVFGGATTDEGRALTREALAEGRAQRITRRRRKDGTPVDVELMFVPLAVDGARVGFLAIYHDITELQLAREEAEAATQAKSAFLATMSHEIRTPMNAVIGMTGLLLGTELTDEQREFAEIVRSSGDALLHVIDDVLDYSKIEAGKLELESEPFELRECVEGALEIVAPRAWEKTIELGCLIDEAAPAGIVGDAGRLRQVLLNLLSNAVKFTEVGEVVVHVDAEPAGANAYRLRFAVRDTGIGIPKGRMDTLFESFSQVDASTTRRYGGTGLGLAISRRLVELMGGTMRAESEEGKGSTFQIELSVEAAELPTRRAEHDALPQLAGKRVLVVDDNATNREIVARHVRSWGMEPVPAETPAEAVARIERGERFDVAVLDMMMPDMDGVDLARAIRRHRDEHELPLVLLTSFGRLPQLATEFAVQLAKPVKGSQLYNALLRALAEHAPEPKAAAQQRERVEHATSPLRILLAEDNAVNQKVALRLLTQLGYGADVVWNGREALEALERQRYDVVLMDVQMPELDGLDASRRICGRWPAGERPHIIAMTANAMPEDREICFAAGMNDYVAKPIRPGELAQALKRAPMLGDAAEQGGDEPDVSLDAGALDSLRGFGGDDFLAELIGTFLNDAPSLLATLRDSLERQDVEELRRAAHTLKSNGQTFGAEQFGEVCRELEDRARNGELDGATEVVDRIDREYGRLERALAALRSQPS
jgi:PAS domain S-box-containing protein